MRRSGAEKSGNDSRRTMNYLSSGAMAQTRRGGVLPRFRVMLAVTALPVSGVVCSSDDVEGGRGLPARRMRVDRGSRPAVTLAPCGAQLTGSTRAHLAG